MDGLRILERRIWLLCLKEPYQTNIGDTFYNSFVTLITVKNCIIIHGGPLTAIPEVPHSLHTLYWQPWVKNEIEKHGILCCIPSMSSPWQPYYTDWKAELEKQTISEDTILVGHSRGVAFLIRWLGETKQQVKKLIMVAPNLKTESDDPVLRDFYSFNVDLEIQKQVSERIVFTSENDDLENMESAKLLARVLKCKVINLPMHGHFITQEMGTDEFGELVAEIIK